MSVKSWSTLRRLRHYVGKTFIFLAVALPISCSNEDRSGKDLGPDGFPKWAWPKSQGKPKKVSRTIVVAEGKTYDGKQRFHVGTGNLGDGSQKEGQRPLFVVYGTLKNVNYEKADGIHFMEGSRGYNLWCYDVGEDGITIMGDNVNLKRVGLRKAKDKAIQHNYGKNFRASDMVGDDVEQFYRQNGGSKEALQGRFERVWLRGVRVGFHADGKHENSSVEAHSVSARDVETLYLIEGKTKAKGDARE